MSVELKVPGVGESITEVEIGDWLKAEGDRVERDEVVTVIETDKATVEISAPVTGKLSKIKKRTGQSAVVGEVIGIIEEGAAPAREKGGGPTTLEPSSASSSAAPAPVRPGVGAEANVRVMPAARRELAERGLSAEEVTATGPGRRLLKEDVVQHSRGGGRPERAPVREAQPPPAAPTPSGDEEVVPMTVLRRRIAERLVQAQQTAALLTTFNEIDMSEVIALRREYRDSFQEKFGVRLGFMSFFVKASVEALKLVPQVNAEIRGANIVYRNYYDIGVAIGGGKGLVVPVLRRAERLSFAEIEQAIGDFSNRAQSNKLKLEELEGGTFTISNGGIYGSLLSTPIVNPPQSGILGMHAIQDRPVARDGSVVIRPMMYVALTYDHRIVDGREAVTFLRHIKELIEDPARILLEV